MRLPTPFGRYLLVDKIATGGMAEIFKAKLIGVEGFEKTVVIKRILPFWSERRDFVLMLIDEAKILVHLNHPNIVQVFELGCDEGTYFIAMEYVEGIDLRHLLMKSESQKKTLPQDMTLAILIESLRGLHYAHHRSLKEKGFLGIVHRDISPQNILLSFDGEVKVTDFGIAKAMTQTHETQTGVLKGKYAYMSPEQAVGLPLDARSDLFACGVMLYELLFHQRLFASKNDLETLEKVRKAEVHWPEEKIKELHPGIIEVLRKSLALKPQDRFVSAEEFADALQACIPSQKKIGPKDLAAFVSDLLRDEIKNRRLHETEVINRTRSFMRHTQISPPSSEDTVSIIESNTELENFPKQEISHKGFVLLPKVSKKKALGFISILMLAAIFSILLLKYRSLLNQNINLAKSQPALEIAKSDPLPPKPGSTPPPSHSPTNSTSSTVASVLGSINLNAFPTQANILVNYPGGKTKGEGKVFVEKLPVGSEIKASVQFPNYETENKSFQISADQLNLEYTFRLNKKAPGFGSVSVNAVPWGKVSMAGFIGGSETPVSQGKIPEGSYRVQVSNPALKKTVSAMAIVKAGRTTRCHADLEGSGNMYCK